MTLPSRLKYLLYLAGSPLPPHPMANLTLVSTVTAASTASRLTNRVGRHRD